VGVACAERVAVAAGQNARLVPAQEEVKRESVIEAALDAYEADTLMGQATKYDPGNFFDPTYTMLCRLPKRLLPART